MASTKTLEQRVDTLESVLGQFIVHTDTSLNRLSRSLEEFKEEMRSFKDEMKGFKDEMLEFKEEMRSFKDEMKDFKNEMLEFKDRVSVFMSGVEAFKDEMKNFKDEMRLFKTDTNKKWGELANKMGTMVEDLIDPAFVPLIKRCFKEDVIDKAIRIRRRRSGEEGEFDLVAATETKVFVVEVKSTVTVKSIEQFVVETLPRFRKFFPEYESKPLYPVLAALRIEPSVVEICTRNRVYAMAYREWDYMDILNLMEIGAQ